MKKYPVLESVSTQKYNTLTAPNIPEHDNPPVAVSTPHPRTLREKNFPEVIIPDHNFQPKLKAHAGFVRNIVVLCPSLYIYHDEVRRYDLIEEFTEIFGPYTYGRIVQVPNVQKI